MNVDLSSQQQAAAIVLAGLTTLSISANAVIGVWQKLASMRSMRDPARMPPLAEEAAKIYATKAELFSVREEWRLSFSDSRRHLEEVLKEIFTLLRQSGERNYEWQSGVATQLGHIHEALDVLKRKVL